MKNPVLSASMAFLTRLNLQFTSKIENWRFDLNRAWCGPQSRQKPGEMYDFCLPDSPKSVRTAPRVEQNHPKLRKCSTADSKFGSRCSESRTKSRKIEKMFYR